MNLTLEERTAIAAAVWPDDRQDIAWRLYRAACVRDIEEGYGTPTVSRVDRERVEAEIKKREATKL